MGFLAEQAEGSPQRVYNGRGHNFRVLAQLLCCSPTWIRPKPNMNIITDDVLGNHTPSALQHNARERGCKHWRLPFKPTREGAQTLTTNCREISSHLRCLSCLLINNTEWLTEQRTWCVHTRNSCIRTAVHSPVKNVKNKHQYILAARCCWFQGRYKEFNFTVSIKQVLGSGCALLCEVLEDKQREVSC